MDNCSLRKAIRVVLTHVAIRGKRILKPIRVYGSQFSPVHFSPTFAVLFFAGLVIVELFSLPFSIRTGLPQLAEWGVFFLLAMLFSFIAGLLPPFLVSMKRKRGYPSAYGWLLIISLIPLLALHLSSGGKISLVPTFFETAGGIAVVLLFLWRGIDYIGTHDSDREAHHEWIMHNAVRALLRRSEITREEAGIVDPIEIDRPSLIPRLECLDPITRLAVEREMIVEEVVQANQREFSLRS